MRLCLKLLRVANKIKTGLICVVVSGVIHGADAIRLKPGQWEIHSSTRVPALSQSVSNQVVRCLKMEQVDPSGMFNESQQCSVSDKTFDDNSMTWRLQCTLPGKGTFEGRGEFISEGDRAKGATVLLVPHQGQDVELKTTWLGHRIGECKTP